MDSFRRKKSPGSDRFLGLYSSSPPPSAAAAFELDEQDIFSTDTDSKLNPNPNPIPIHSHSFLNPNLSGSPLSPFRRERNFGVLAVLPEESKHRNDKFLQRKPSISPAASPSSSSARIVIPKPKVVDFSGKIEHHHQSAPVNVPVVSGRLRRDQVERDDSGAAADEDEMMMPPHEIVDRAQGKREPLTTFSVLEGVGRTLKGRDLRRVRNAVWRKTGFLD